MRESEPKDIKTATVRGISWKIAAEIVTQATRIVLLLILARLLAPEDFGLAAIVLAFLVFVPVLADLALGAALISKPVIDEDDRSTVFWTTIPLGAFFTALGIALSWPLAALFNDDQLQPLFAVFSVSFLIASLTSTPQALLKREMAFRPLELRVMGGTIAGAIVAVVLAIQGFGPWALVGGELTNRTLSLVLIWLQCDWRPALRFSTTRLRQLAGYSSAVLGAHLLMQFSATAQTLMVGRLLGPSALGTLTVSQTVVSLPFNRIATPIQEVLFPAFSRIQDDRGRIRGAWIRVNQVVAAVAFPALAGLAVLAVQFTDVVLGARWEGSSTVLRILSIAGMALALQGFNFSILQALAYTRSLLWISAVAAVSAIAAVAVGAHWGLNGAATAIALQTIFIQGVFMSITARAVDSSLAAIVRPLGRIMLATLVMAASVYALQHLLVRVGSSSTEVLLACSAFGVAVYVPALRIFEPKLIRDVRDLARTVRAGRQDNAPAGSLTVTAKNPRSGAR